MQQALTGQLPITPRRTHKNLPHVLHPFLSLIPSSDRQQAIALFQTGAEFGKTPDAVLTGVLSTWAALTLERACALSERLSARRTCCTLLKHRETAREFAAQILQRRAGQ